MPEKIQSREATCKCGCKGRDPWHARFFLREVRDVQPTDRFDSITIGFWIVQITNAATVTFPWGDETIYRRVTQRIDDGRIISDEWCRESLINHPFAEKSL